MPQIALALQLNSVQKTPPALEQKRCLNSAEIKRAPAINSSSGVNAPSSYMRHQTSTRYMGMVSGTSARPR